jgi:hypothetical protein
MDIWLPISTREKIDKEEPILPTARQDKLEPNET